jgi:all-trans-retinol dehydrogenase (NAD+)
MAFAFNSIQKLEDVILNPFVTGPLLLVLTNGPTVIREPLLSQLVALINRQNVKRLILGLKWALALGLVQKINSWLNAVALTNWQVRPAKDKWVWDSEIAVVTGGSSGIGAEIVKCLVRKGVQVAVLDIQPLPKDMDGCKL